MLTEREIRAKGPREADYKLTDAGGLHLFVSSSGRRTWRLRYRWERKEQLLTLGAYPEMSLKAARAAREEVKKLLASGRDPRLEAKRIKLVGEGGERTFEEIAREWHGINKGRWKPVHADDVLTSMENDLFPDLGKYGLGNIDEPLVLAVLRKVEARGAIEKARRLRQRIERVFKYAKANGIVATNPADVREALSPVPRKRRWPAIVDIDALHEFIDEVDTAGASPVTRLASRFLALTAQRPGMVRGMAWAEVLNVDWKDPAGPVDKALWRIPAARMKQEMDLRDDEAFDHDVPLARQAVETLRAVRRLTGYGPLPFPSSRDAHEAMSENAIGYLYNRSGYKGRHVPHGWRSSFSTIMNDLVERRHPGEDRLVIDRLIIDLMLAHRPSGMSAAEFRYNRAAYMPRRREIAQTWADMLLKGRADAVGLLEGRRRSKAR